MIYTTDRQKRFDIFDYLSARILINKPEWALTPEEYSDWWYLRIFFFEEYAMSRLKPWRKPLTPSYMQDKND